jgi:hypothetical protein
MSLAPRYATLSRGPPPIVAWEQGPDNLLWQPECPSQRGTGDNSPVGEYLKNLLEGILHHKLATATLSTAVDAPHNEWNYVALPQAAQNESTGEATKSTRHVQDSALLMKCIEFYE